MAKDTTPSVVVYGSSDDLIEVEGILDDEFYYATYGEEFLLFDEGTVLAIQYTDEGIWRLRVARAGTATVSIERCESDGSDDDYSDRASITGVKSVKHLQEWSDGVCDSLSEFVEHADSSVVEWEIEECSDGPDTLALAVRGTPIKFKGIIDGDLVAELLRQVAKGTHTQRFQLIP